MHLIALIFFVFAYLRHHCLSFFHSLSSYRCSSFACIHFRHDDAYHEFELCAYMQSLLTDYKQNVRNSRSSRMHAEQIGCCNERARGPFLDRKRATLRRADNIHKPRMFSFYCSFAYLMVLGCFYLCYRFFHHTSALCISLVPFAFTFCTIFITLATHTHTFDMCSLINLISCRAQSARTRAKTVSR